MGPWAPGARAQTKNKQKHDNNDNKDNKDKMKTMKTTQRHNKWHLPKQPLLLAQ